MRLLLWSCVAMMFLMGSSVHAMTSTNFRVNWDSINSGGEDVSTSTNYILRDTIGEQAVGFSTSTNYAMRAGYRQGDTDATLLRFSIGTQVNASKTSYTAFDMSGNTVTVSSPAQFTEGVFIGVVEDEGFIQKVAIGKIISIVGNVLTVDAWDGNPSSIGATPSGGDDFVYRMDGDRVEFGAMNPSAGVTSLTHTDVTSNVEHGYTVSVHADGELRHGVSATIAGVADGEVSLGSEEYGARVFGTMATSTGSDFAFATLKRPIQESETYAGNERVGLVYKISITSGTPAGNYGQSVFFTLTANF